MIDYKVVYLWSIIYFMRSNKDLNIIKKESKIIENKRDPEKDKEATQPISQQIKKDSAQISLFQEVG